MLSAIHNEFCDGSLQRGTSDRVSERNCSSDQAFADSFHQMLRTPTIAITGTINSDIAREIRFLSQVRHLPLCGTPGCCPLSHDFPTFIHLFSTPSFRGEPNEVFIIIAEELHSTGIIRCHEFLLCTRTSELLPEYNRT